MVKYKHLFFDLDRTLWDFDKNNSTSLNEVFVKYALEDKLNSDFKAFFVKYHELNNMLWEAYNKGQIKKDLLHVRRFDLTFEHFGYKNVSLAAQFADEYLGLAPLQTELMPYAVECLTQLKPLANLYVITNGFKDVQYRKLKNSRLDSFFKDVFISEEIGHQKPNRAFFEIVLERSGAKLEESLIIGDDMKSDIQGAYNIGMDSVLYNPNNHVEGLIPTYTINSLTELKDLII